eukprot:6183082-Pleurochrysis_carterae.AAC.1
MSQGEHDGRSYKERAYRSALFSTRFPPLSIGMQLRSQLECSFALNWNAISLSIKMQFNSKAISL